MHILIVPLLTHQVPMPCDSLLYLEQSLLLLWKLVYSENHYLPPFPVPHDVYCLSQHLYQEAT